MRFVACLAGPVAVATWTLACGPGPTGATSSDPSGSDDAGPPPVPTVTLPGTTQQSGESGLCTSWSSTVVDLSSLPVSAWGVLVHGVERGFSVVAVGTDDARLAALAFDPTGTARGAEVDLPIETGVPSDVIETSEGGWLVGWSSGTTDPYAYLFYVVHYDANGTPTGQTDELPGAGAVFGAEPGGTTDVAWWHGDSSWLSQRGTVSGYPFALSAGPTFAAGDAEAWFGWHLGTLLSLECPHPDVDVCAYGDSPTLRTWNTAGQLGLDAVLPTEFYLLLSQGMVSAMPGADPSTALLAQANGVTFVSGSQMLVVPTDILLNGASVWPSPTVAGAQRAVVGFDGHVEGDGGASDALQIVEVSSTGARSVIGQATLPPNAARGLASSTVTLTATVAEDAYMIVLAGPTLEGAVFTCTGRAS